MLGRPITLLFLILCIPLLASAQQITYPTAFTGITFSSPVDVQHPPDGSDRLFVVERGGNIRIVDDIFGTPAKLGTAFFTVPDGTFVFGSERGLLGMAFHPDFATNGYFFVYYTVNPPGSVGTRTVVSRFTISGANPNLTDYTTELDIIGVDHFDSNHNAGQIQFGPDDDYLYVGMGDGGGGGDPGNNGQDKGTLLASMLRLDIDGGGEPASGCASIAANYTIPKDNPFLDDAGVCDEIFAYGLRNPWRFSFGPDGKFWVADVGQNAHEEVSWVNSGDNMGWDDKEGFACYDTNPCTNPIYMDPIYSHPHNFGGSITGGYVYEGLECGALSGQYFFAEYVQGFTRSLVYDNTGLVQTNVLPNLSSVSTFGRDRKGNLYVVRLNGQLRKIDCSNLMGVNIKVNLAGPYDEDLDAMTVGLSDNSLVPDAQPYNDDFFNGAKAEHDGNETLDLSLFSSVADVVDWVTVELRPTPSAAALVKRAALLLKDGSVVDFDGGIVRFFNQTGDNHVVIHHRNHLSIMSATTVSLSTSPTLYDFTTAQSTAHGSNPMVELETGVFGMHGGDGSSTDGVTAFDFLNFFLPFNGSNGYLAGDFNLSGDVSAFDFLNVWLLGNGSATQVP